MTFDLREAKKKTTAHIQIQSECLVICAFNSSTKQSKKQITQKTMYSRLEVRISH